MSKTNFSKRIMALFLSLAMVIGLMPSVTLPGLAAEQANLTVIDKVADPDSFDNWQDYYGDNSLLPDGTRGISTWKAGGVWTDKSVYADSAEFPDSVTMDNKDKNFLVALSALASNEEIVGQSSIPADTMLVLDLSQSMDNSGSVDDMIEAANETLDVLLKMNVNNRVGVVLYSGNSSTGSLAGTNTATVILPLDRYTTTTTTTQWEGGQRVTKYQYLSVSGTSDTSVSVASGTRNSSNAKPTGSKNTVGGTYIQNGLFKAWQEFEDMDDKGVVQSGAQAGTQRQPILILMSDGRPTLATEDYNNVGTSDSDYGNGNESSTTNQTVFLTQLTAAWVKGAVKDHYNDADMKFYTLGLSTGNDTYATNVLNPGSTTNTSMLTWWSNFISGTKRNDGTVRVQNSSWGQSAWDLPYDDDRFATSVGRNYTDGYWSADDVDEMIEKFKQIVAEIGLQSAYSATLVESGNADLDGYITVQDELGAMMQVKDVKGILIGNTLFSGAELAKSMNSGALGSVDTPTAYGDEFVRTVKERLGLTDKTGANGETITATSQAQQLIQAAYMDGQLSYNTATGAYSNYIGWYGDADNAYLSFWNKDTGITAIGAPEGAKYINRSYGYLGGASTEEDAADMMHIVVMVRTEISTGHQTVLFKIPSSLIPMVEYKVELDGNSLETANELTLTVEEKDPIRLVYEVGLPDDVNSINIHQKVADYLAQDGSNHIHKDANGNYVFYANGWDDNHDDVAPVISNLTDAQKLELTKYVAESHFVPNTANERFYIQENSVVYTRNGSAYVPVTSGINANGTYYFARTIVTIAGNNKAQAVTQYEQLQPATIANANNFEKNGAGQWEVKAGTIRQQLSNVVLPKTDENGDPANLTGTIANTDQLWVNVTSNDPSNYNIYSFLGNNGKLTVAPATGIKVTKNVTELADGASAEEEFSIIVTIDAQIADPVVTDTDGNLLEDYTSRVSAGQTVVTLNLADDESAVITGLPTGVRYTVTEEAHKQYTASYTGATATVAGTIVEGVVTNEPKGYGDLIIVKDINGMPENMSEDMAAAMAEQVFTFEVDLGDDFANAGFAVDAANAQQNVLTDGKLFANAQGVITVKLRENESISILDIPEGTAYTVTETDIPDGYIVAQSSNGTQSGAIQKDVEHDVHFVNSYDPDPVNVSVDFTINKEIDGSTYNDAEDFTFQVQMLSNEGGYVNVGDPIIVANGGSMTTAFTRSREFTNIGTYHFRIVEVEGSTNGMTYSSMRALFAVVVTDENADGVLEATLISEGNAAVSGNDVTATFTNTYEVGSTYVEIDMYKDLVNETGIEISKTNFHFGLYKQGETTPVYTITSGEQGYAEIRIPVTDVNQNGETYILREIVPADGDKIPGMTYSAKEYTVVLNVIDNQGQLEATYTVDGIAETVNADDDVEATFKNEYALDSTSYNLTAKKILNDKTPGNHKFTFALHQTGSSFAHDANTVKETQQNDGDGSVAFSKLTFPKAGNYYYVIVEQAGTNPGMTYDTTHYHVTVTVGIDLEDATKLKVTNVVVNKIGTNSDTSGEIVFVNTYAIIKPEEVIIDGIKTLKINSGLKNMSAGDYTFGLFDAEGNLLVDSEGKEYKTTNLANGTFRFDAITYTGADIGKTYEYVVREIAPDGTTDGSYSAGGVKWSGEYRVVRVSIYDNGDGTIRAEVSGNGADKVKFVNEYRSKPVSVSLPATKHLDGRDLVAEEFEYVLYKSEATFNDRDLINNQITHDEEGNITFNFGTLGMGYHYFVVKEVIPEIRAIGIQYDASEYYITIQVLDSGNGQMSYLTTVKHSGDPNAVNPDIAFNNIYQPEPGELVLSGTKTYNGGKALEDDVFSVGLYDASGERLDTADVKANGDFVFQALEYTAADIGQTYTYTVKERIPNGAAENTDGTFTFGSNIYDGTVYTVEVTITDADKDGALEIVKAVTQNGDSVDELTFTNTFVPDPITHKIQAKKIYEKGLKGGDFEFKLVSADGKTNVDQTKENAVNGDIIFDSITFSAAGEYKFKLTEKKDSIFSFILPSQAEYEITITVVNENGVLRVSNVDTLNTKNTGETDLEFINTYVLDGEDEITLRGTKKLNGDRTQVKENEFEFGLYDAEGKLVESVKNDADGNFAFTTLKFDEKDVPVNGQKQITYTVKEIAGDNARYTYDDAIYTVVVTVKDNDQGGVTASYTVNDAENGAISFTNTYTNPTPVTYTPMAKKNYNKTLSGGEFKFKLEGEINGTPVSQEKTNAAGGSITFDTLSFPEAGTYTFTVKEIDKVLGFIEYSTAEYELVVNIIDTKGVLSLGSVTVDNDPDGTIEFTNTYVIDGEDEITLRGTKTLTGGRTTFVANEFEFGLYDAEGKLVESVKNDADGNFAFTTLKFDEKDVPVNGQKQITYTVKEIAGSDIRVTYDETVYTVVVTVKDNEQGGVTASYTVNSEADGSIAFTNIYTPKPEDITVDFDIIKTVVNKGSEKIGPEGFEFLLNALADGVADITVKADENGKAKFTLTFTEDDIGKTYTYKLTEVNGGKANVTYSNAEYTITVAINLNENNELVATLTNNSENVTAVVTEFENVYDYTENPDSPQTGDNTKLHLWIALLFVSSAGIIGTMLYGRKRKEEN